MRGRWIAFTLGGQSARDAPFAIGITTATLILRCTVCPGLSQRVHDLIQERGSDQDTYVD